MRKAVFVVMRLLVMSIGATLIVLTFDQGFGVTMPLYWWFVLGAGFGILASGWDMKYGDIDGGR